MLHIRRFTAKHNYSPANIIAMDEKPVGWIWSQTLQWIRQVLVQSQWNQQVIKTVYYLYA